MATELIIDGDILCYKAAFAAEDQTNWGDGVWSWWADEKRAVVKLLESIDETESAYRLASNIEDEEVILKFALSGGGNFRFGIMPEYKSNRKDKRKPLVLEPLKGVLRYEYECYDMPNLEGDDIMGILATEPSENTRVLVSIDKDMQTIPARWFNPGNDTLLSTSVEEADRYHLLQTIAGDPTDGYSGVPGFGMIGAAKILDEGKILERTIHTFTRGARKGEQEERWVPGEDGTPWEVVVSAYASRGLSEAVALQNARVARILRAGEYNKETGEVSVWEPPTQ